MQLQAGGTINLQASSGMCADPLLLFRGTPAKEQPVTSPVAQTAFGLYPPGEVRTAADAAETTGARLSVWRQRRPDGSYRRTTGPGTSKRSARPACDLPNGNASMLGSACRRIPRPAYALEDSL